MEKRPSFWPALSPVFGALVAGISRMHWRTFLLYNILGGATWATASVLVGYFPGGSFGLVERWIGRATALLFIVLAVGVVLYLLSNGLASILSG